MIGRALAIAVLVASTTACGEEDGASRGGGSAAGGKADEIAGDAGALADGGETGADAGAASELALEVACHGPPLGITFDVDVLIDPDTSARTIHVENGFASPLQLVDLAVDVFETTPDDFLVYRGPDVGLQIDLLTETEGENLALFVSSLVEDGRNIPVLCQLDPSPG
jgi:hypothetical protein